MGDINAGTQFSLDVWAYLREQAAGVVDEQQLFGHSQSDSGKNVPLIDGAKVTVTLRLMIAPVSMMRRLWIRSRGTGSPPARSSW